jgi:AraC-like DNA-binding protein
LKPNTHVIHLSPPQFTYIRYFAGQPLVRDKCIANLTEKPNVNVSFSLHDLSQALNIPLVRVTTCFNKELNTSFPSYRNKLRVDHAISLLREGAHLTTSIEGVAERSGFKSKPIFYAAFKKEYGTTPTEWIKENL